MRALQCRRNSNGTPSGAASTALLVAALLAGMPARAGTFADQFRTPLERSIANTLAASIGRSLPVITASAGFSYRFHPETDTFERETSILGQLFLEWAEPLGRRTLNVSLSYQRVKLDTLDGKDLDALSDTQLPFLDPTTGIRFRIPHLRIFLDTEQATTSVTYGVTDDADINVTVPVVYSNFQFDGSIKEVGISTPLTIEHGGTALGVGDIFVRGKYRVVNLDSISGALGMVLRIPTGEKGDFQGTGSVEISPLVYVSSAALPVGRFLALHLYLNAGVDFVTDDVDSSEARWGVGLDCAVLDRLTAAVAVLGRHPFNRLAPPGTFSFTRVVPQTGQIVSADIFGIVPGRPAYYDLSVGGRVNLWHEWLLGFANATVPLNNDGFRANVVPLAGIEAIF